MKRRFSSALIFTALFFVAASRVTEAQSIPAQTSLQPAPQPVRINVDLNAKTGPFTPIYAWFGYDEANYTTMPHGRELLGELQRTARPEPGSDTHSRASLVHFRRR
jgi:hypothetical protein